MCSRLDIWLYVRQKNGKTIDAIDDTWSYIPLWIGIKWITTTVLQNLVLMGKVLCRTVFGYVQIPCSLSQVKVGKTRLPAPVSNPWVNNWYDSQNQFKANSGMRDNLGNESQMFIIQVSVTYFMWVWVIVISRMGWVVLIISDETFLFVCTHLIKSIFNYFL